MFAAATVCYRMDANTLNCSINKSLWCFHSEKHAVQAGEVSVGKINPEAKYLQVFFNDLSSADWPPAISYDLWLSRKSLKTFIIGW